MLRVLSKEREEMAYEHEERCSRRMTNVELPSRRNELAAVPEGSGGLEREEIRSRGDGKSHPAEEDIPRVEFFKHITEVFNYYCRIFVTEILKLLLRYIFATSSIHLLYIKSPKK